jgi:hypothetical protein
MEGIKWKRMFIALLVAAFFGVFCAYGTSTIDIEGFEVTLPYFLTVFYARLLIGFFVGFGENVKFVNGEMKNSVVRGAIFGVIATIVISFYGGGEIFMAFGIVYGIITDVLATKFGK